MAMYKHLFKLCPLCFKGKLVGYPEAKCDKCGKVRPTPAAWARGSEIGASLENYVKGKDKKLHPEITHPVVKKLASKLRAGFKKGWVQVEKLYSFTKDWRLIPGEGWTREAWLFVKMDVETDEGSDAAGVVDWKTGGIDNRTGEIRSAGKYGDQLRTYQVAKLIISPGAKLATAGLCCVDAGHDIDPRVMVEPLAREDLDKEKKRLTKLALPLLTDDTFAPRPSDKCRWCDYSKGKGGPCPF